MTDQLPQSGGSYILTENGELSRAEQPVGPALAETVTEPKEADNE